MTDYSKLVKRAFPKVTEVVWYDGCEVGLDQCIKYPCHDKMESCPASVVLIKRHKRVIGWIGADGRVSKMNPMPSKRYRKRVLGLISDAKRTGKREQEED